MKSDSEQKMHVKCKLCVVCECDYFFSFQQYSVSLLLLPLDCNTRNLPKYHYFAVIRKRYLFCLFSNVGENGDDFWGFRRLAGKQGVKCFSSPFLYGKRCCSCFSFLLPFAVSFQRQLVCKITHAEAAVIPVTWFRTCMKVFQAQIAFMLSFNPFQKGHTFYPLFYLFIVCVHFYGHKWDFSIAVPFCVGYAPNRSLLIAHQRKKKHGEGCCVFGVHISNVLQACLYLVCVVLLGL